MLTRAGLVARRASAQTQKGVSLLTTSTRVAAAGTAVMRMGREGPFVHWGAKHTSTDLKWNQQGVRAMSTDKPAEEGEKAEGEAPQAEEPPKPEGPKIFGGEKAVGEEEGHSFKAETRQLLDIVANSLYQDKEVFIRELVSNASDALEKARFLALSEGGGANTLAEGEELKVTIALDSDKELFMIQDNGVGMSHDELRDNLGTIARSGSKEFLKELGSKDASSDTGKNIIGKFGVGFYSCFMVAEEVTVYSRKRGESQGHMWTMHKNDGTYGIRAAEGVEVGTKIVLKLKDGCLDFASVGKVREAVGRFSTFVSFPVTVNNSQVNEVSALWLADSAKVTDEQHSALFKHLTNAWDEYMYNLMYKADAPIDIKSVFYIPVRSDEAFGQSKNPSGVHLYSRRVLIQKHAQDLLPDYLRFVKGVVDSEDLPLSISRETMQDKALLGKLKTVLTKRVIRWLNDEAKKDNDKYLKFYDVFGLNIKEGVAMDQPNTKELVKLLRYSTSAIADNSLTSLQEYVDRMKPKQNTIYYLVTSDRKAALASPYYEAFKRMDVEVIFAYGLHDEIVMGNTGKFGDYEIKSIEIAEPPELDTKDEGETKEGEEKKDGEESKEESEKKAEKKKKDANKLSKEQQDEIISWLRITLDNKVTDVGTTSRLVDSPAIISEHDTAVTRRMMQMEEFRALGIHTPSSNKLLINPGHPLIKSLWTVRHSKPTIAKLVAEQLLDDAKISAGIMDHVQEMMPRMNQILLSALTEEGGEPEAEPEVHTFEEDKGEPGAPKQ